MKRILRVLLVLIIIVLLVAGARALVKHKRAALAQAPHYGVRPIPVKVVQARRTDLKESWHYLAVAEPVRTATLSARVTARIDRVLCDEGDMVKAGQVLVELDCRQVRDNIAATQAQIAQAEAQLAASEATERSLASSTAYRKREAERDKTLADKGDIPASSAEATADKANEFEGRLEATRKGSEALRHLIHALKEKKAEVETQLTYYTLKSPYDGVLSSRLVDPGDMASPGKQLVVVEDRSQVKLAFDVPQQDLPAVKEGLEVGFPVDGQSRTAALSRLFPSLSEARMLRAEVDLTPQQAAGLSTGAYVPVTLVLRVLKGVTVVPSSCLVECPKGRQHVFVAKGGELSHPIVKVLTGSGDDVAVEGIEPGDQVVTSTFLGWALLSAGQKVEVIR